MVCHKQVSQRNKEKGADSWQFGPWFLMGQYKTEKICAKAGTKRHDQKPCKELKIIVKSNTPF